MSIQIKDQANEISQITHDSTTRIEEVMKDKIHTSNLELERIIAQHAITADRTLQVLCDTLEENGIDLNTLNQVKENCNKLKTCDQHQSNELIMENMSLLAKVNIRSENARNEYLTSIGDRIYNKDKYYEEVHADAIISEVEQLTHEINKMSQTENIKISKEVSNSAVADLMWFVLSMIQIYSNIGIKAAQDKQKIDSTRSLNSSTMYLNAYEKQLGAIKEKSKANWQDTIAGATQSANALTSLGSSLQSLKAINAATKAQQQRISHDDAMKQVGGLGDLNHVTSKLGIEKPQDFNYSSMVDTAKFHSAKDNEIADAVNNVYLARNKEMLNLKKNFADFDIKHRDNALNQDVLIQEDFKDKVLKPSDVKKRIHDDIDKATKVYQKNNTLDEADKKAIEKIKQHVLSANNKNDITLDAIKDSGLKLVIAETIDKHNLNILPYSATINMEASVDGDNLVKQIAPKQLYQDLSKTRVSDVRIYVDGAKEGGYTLQDYLPVLQKQILQGSQQQKIIKDANMNDPELDNSITQKTITFHKIRELVNNQNNPNSQDTLIGASLDAVDDKFTTFKLKDQPDCKLLKKIDFDKIQDAYTFLVEEEKNGQGQCSVYKINLVKQQNDNMKMFVKHLCDDDASKLYDNDKKNMINNIFKYQGKENNFFVKATANDLFNAMDQHNQTSSLPIDKTKIDEIKAKNGQDKTKAIDAYFADIHKQINKKETFKDLELPHQVVERLMQKNIKESIISDSNPTLHILMEKIPKNGDLTQELFDELKRYTREHGGILIIDRTNNNQTNQEKYKITAYNDLEGYQTQEVKNTPAKEYQLDVKQKQPKTKNGKYEEYQQNMRELMDIKNNLHDKDVAKQAHLLLKYHEKYNMICKLLDPEISPIPAHTLPINSTTITLIKPQQQNQLQNSNNLQPSLADKIKEDEKKIATYVHKITEKNDQQTDIIKKEKNDQQTDIIEEENAIKAKYNQQYMNYKEGLKLQNQSQTDLSKKQQELSKQQNAEINKLKTELNNMKIPPNNIQDELGKARHKMQAKNQIEMLHDFPELMKQVNAGTMAAVVVNSDVNQGSVEIAWFNKADEAYINKVNYTFQNKTEAATIVYKLAANDKNADSINKMKSNEDMKKALEQQKGLINKDATLKNEINQMAALHQRMTATIQGLEADNKSLEQVNKLLDAANQRLHEYANLVNVLSRAADGATRIWGSLGEALKIQASKLEALVDYNKNMIQELQKQQNDLSDSNNTVLKIFDTVQKLLDAFGQFVHLLRISAR